MLANNGVGTAAPIDAQAKAVAVLAKKLRRERVAVVFMRFIGVVVEI